MQFGDDSPGFNDFNLSVIQRARHELSWVISRYFEVDVHYLLTLSWLWRKSHGFETLDGLATDPFLFDPSSWQWHVLSCFLKPWLKGKSYCIVRYQAPVHAEQPRPPYQYQQQPQQQPPYQQQPRQQQQQQQPKQAPGPVAGANEGMSLWFLKCVCSLK